MTILRFIFGVLGIILGMILVLKSEWFLSFFGRIPFAERHLGTEGGSRLMYKMIGLVIIFIALIYLTGGIQSILSAIFLPGIS